MADTTVSKELLANPFYVHPLHDKLRIVINVLNIEHKPRARTELNYVNIKNIYLWHFSEQVCHLQGTHNTQFKTNDKLIFTRF